MHMKRGNIMFGIAEMYKAAPGLVLTVAVLLLVAVLLGMAAHVCDLSI